MLIFLYAPYDFCMLPLKMGVDPPRMGGGFTNTEQEKPRTFFVLGT